MQLRKIAVLVTLCTYAAVVLSDIEEAPANGQEARVSVTGEQFTWTFEYTGADGKKFSTNQLYVEHGKSVKFDVESKDVLLEALEDFGGTLIFVSHDRYFVERLATKIIEVGNGQAALYPGTYEAF